MSQEDKDSEKQLAREVGGVIAMRRKAKGLTQAQLAEHMDIEKESVSRIETGHIAPSLARLAQIAKLLDCEICDLLNVGTPDINGQTLALINRMEDLSESQKTVLLRLFSKLTLALAKLSSKDRKIVEKFFNDLFL